MAMLKGEIMKEYTKQEITELEIYLKDRLDQVELMQDKEEMTQRGDVLLNVFKVLQNYEELAPLLTEFLDKKHYKEKWGKEKYANQRDVI